MWREVSGAEAGTISVVVPSLKGTMFPSEGSNAHCGCHYSFLVVSSMAGSFPSTALVEIPCTQLASACRQGESPDYAAALQEAKRWVRRDPRWESPFFWAPFVLLGPP